MKNGNKHSNNIVPFSLGVASTSMSYVVISQLTFCLTDSYAMSAILVGTIFLVSRFFDGFTDIIAGIIIDKTHTKWGKARPFDLFAIPLWILLLLCFNIPDFQLAGKVIWVFLTYNLCQSVCYTFVTVSQTVRVRRSFAEEARSKALSVAGLASAIASTAVGVLSPTLIAVFQDKPHGWTIIIGCFAIPGIIMTLVQFFLLPELDVEDEERTEKVTIVDAVKALFANKYIFIVALAVMIIAMVNTVIQTTGNYYFKYVVNNLSMLSLVNLLSLVGYVLLLFMPLLTKCFGNRKTMILAFALIASCNLLKYAFKFNVLGIAVCVCGSAIGITLAMCMRDLLVIDCMKYGQLKSNNNFEGIYASVKGFSDKVALGVGSVLAGAVLEFGGYNSSLEIQSHSAVNAIQFSYAGLPAILGLIGCVIMILYGLEKKLKQMTLQKEVKEA